MSDYGTPRAEHWRDGELIASTEVQPDGRLVSPIGPCAKGDIVQFVSAAALLTAKREDSEAIIERMARAIRAANELGDDEIAVILDTESMDEHVARAAFDAIQPDA